jgi:hypothetical protein
VEKEEGIMGFTVTLTDGNLTWNEPYTIPTADPQKWAEETVARFNNSRKPHEKLRTLVKVTIDEEQQKISAPHGDVEHAWEKTNCMTQQSGKYTCYDSYRCKECGVTGKRFGLSPNIELDSKFKKAGYKYCNTAKKLIEKRNKRKARRDKRANMSRR